MAEPKLLPPDADGISAVSCATPGETRAESIRRIQVGATGLFAMVLVMGVASAISNRAQVAEDRAVPDAAPTTEPTDAPEQVDPLADAGVVPVVRDEDEEAGDTAEERTTVPDIEPSGQPSGPARTNAPARN
jgi:hypothetical protein